MKQIKITVPKGLPWLDYSTLSMYQRCPMSYYWRMEQNITLAQPASALINGTAYHEAKAVYLTRIMEGDTHADAKAKAIEAMMPIMMGITDPDPVRNLTVATKTLTKYFDFWETSYYIPKVVEVGFAIDLQNFFFIGRSDSIEDCPFGEIVMETKTTSIVGTRWDFRGDPNMQIDGYVAARYITTGKMPYGGVLDVIPLHKDKVIPPFRLLAPRSEAHVERWMEEVQEWWIAIARNKDSGIFPKNTEMCVPLVGYSCNYRLLCKKFPQPYRQKEIALPGEYKIEKWSPLDFEVKEEDKEKTK